MIKRSSLFLEDYHYNKLDSKIYYFHSVNRNFYRINKMWTNTHAFTQNKLIDDRMVNGVVIKMILLD